ncbi:hypothetical protein ERX46_06975 [Brumimicrobium glaciale]|jgi:hypothetical protein|uniref:Lipoprotein n=1 Tax=Brumimicrobium glaciale TaxID=200475 RepID=A0A4Q4KNS7_9FLAO|nr:hypothetical protein [Brumimicrobium glaciale]RYM35113.1 hypothetical protein ERX46_06975 [Brumimicrobium glaciale]
MVWLKKVTLFILSALFIALTSCESVRSKSEIEQEKAISKEDLISSFFIQIQNWNNQSIPIIDSLGFEISKMDSSLTFLPYSNDYEPSAFGFTAKNKSDFKAFEESTYLSQDESTQIATYKVWRKKLNDLEILDLSIEPHPTLNWLFLVRLRGQE